MADLFVVLSCSSFVYLIICGELFVYGEVDIHVGAPNINVVCWEVTMWF